MNNINLSFYALAILYFNSCISLANADSTVVYPSVTIDNNYEYPPSITNDHQIQSRSQKSYEPYVFGQKMSNQTRNLEYKYIQNQNNLGFNQFPIPYSNIYRHAQLKSINNNTFNHLPVMGKDINTFRNVPNSYMVFPLQIIPNLNNNMSIFPNNAINNTAANNAFMPFNLQNNITNKGRKKAWGNKRNIWPDFYTDFTKEAWDEVMRGPRNLGRMPGGWRFPHISTPDPVTVSDAIVNQFPPIIEEAGNMADFSDWGIFNKR